MPGLFGLHVVSHSGLILNVETTAPLALRLSPRQDGLLRALSVANRRSQASLVAEVQQFLIVLWPPAGPRASSLVRWSIELSFAVSIHLLASITIQHLQHRFLLVKEW